LDRISFANDAYLLSIPFFRDFAGEGKMVDMNQNREPKTGHFHLDGRVDLVPGLRCFQLCDRAGI